MTTTFQVGDVVRHVRHVGARYIIDSIGEVGTRDTEYGITEHGVHVGIQIYALGSELRLVMRAPHVVDGSLEVQFDRLLRAARHAVACGDMESQPILELSQAVHAVERAKATYES